jgi:hypothetical protein
MPWLRFDARRHIAILRNTGGVMQLTIVDVLLAVSLVAWVYLVLITWL